MKLYQYLWPTSWEDFLSKYKNPWYLVDVIISVIVLSFLIFCVFKFIKSTSARVIYIISLSLLFACLAIGLIIAAVMIGSFVILLTIVVLIISGSEIRAIMHNDLGWKGTITTKSNKNMGNVENLSNVLEDAIIHMSKNKCGALITIERKDRITSDRFSRYSDCECEVTSDIIQTIFFKGSPLHDGAAIIREGKIIRAGVIFDSVSVSAAAMPGSLGSRHRAALGITEAFDCVCITVSEETGSIHICENGIIRKCYVSNFKETLLEVLEED